MILIILSFINVIINKLTIFLIIKIILLQIF